MEDLIKHQKVVAIKLLHKLECADPYAILAGGAPRDWYFNKPANDLDFYVHLQSATVHFEGLRWHRLGLKLSRISNEAQQRGEYKCMEHLHRIYEGEEEGVKFQVMVMRKHTSDSVIPMFGASVCKVWWKGKEVQPTSDFLLSHQQKVIFRKDDYTAKEKHISKMMGRYPEYQLVPYANLETYKNNFCKKHNIYNCEYNIVKKIKELTNEETI